MAVRTDVKRMVEMKQDPPSRSKRRVCVIAAPEGFDVFDVEASLEAKGMRTVIASELPRLHGGSIEGPVERAIRNSDLVIGVLAPHARNENVCYEIGFASALYKRVLILVHRGIDTVPFELARYASVRADLGNPKAVDYAIEQVLSSPEPRKLRHRGSGTKSRPIGELADSLLGRLSLLGESLEHKDIESILLEALQGSGVSIVSQSDDPEPGADLAIWVDELDALFGNPVLIEIKTRIKSEEAANRVSSQMAKYLHDRNARFALVIYAHGVPSRQMMHLLIESYVQFLRLDERIQRLRKQSFGRLILELRNVRYHGVNQE